jgi:hypothetical protein
MMIPTVIATAQSGKFDENMVAFPFISRINPSGLGLIVKDLFSDNSEISLYSFLCKKSIVRKGRLFARIRGIG